MEGHLITTCGGCGVTTLSDLPVSSCGHCGADISNAGRVNPDCRCWWCDRVSHLLCDHPI